MPDVIDNVFGPGGVLAREKPDYQPRKGQIELARMIHRMVELGCGSLLAEAPCGSGKSFAALVPLIVTARHRRENKKEGCPTASAFLTKTIALQEQIVHKDLPFLHRVLAGTYPFTYGLLKGKNNYVCRRKVSYPEEGSAKVAPEVMAWARSTRTGDRSEYRGELDSATWEHLSTPSEDCWNIGCPYHESCYATEARDCALSSDIVVANYHVAFGKDGSGLLRYQHIVCDEAHELAHVARDLLGWSASRFAVYRLARLMLELDGDQEPLDQNGDYVETIPTAAQVRKEADGFFFGLLPHIEEESKDTVRVRRAGMIRPDRLCASLKTVREACSHYLEKIDGGLMDDVDRLTLWRTRQLEEGCASVVSRLNAARDANKDGWVFWLEKKQGRDGKAQVSVEGRPFVVAPYLRQIMFGRHLTVCMSATLRSVDGFGFVRRELGTPESAAEMVVESPFNLASQGVLVIPPYVPIPPKFARGGSDAEIAARSA
ncbi:ATP-dependent DNA helicase, partial [Patescibacteria group bacterium]|nr:ATP-dependent DNA helicase [Patescibacteria group bacterium]